MSTENELTCPVCRAKQVYQSACRRCDADLSLLIKALRSLQAAQQHIEQSLLAGEPHIDAALAYLRWLSPSAARVAIDRYPAGDKVA